MVSSRAALKTSCSTWAYSYWELPEALASIARVGYRGVEILVQKLRRPDGTAGPDHHLRPEWPAGRLDEIHAQLRRLDLQPVCLSTRSDFLKPHSGSVAGDIEEVSRTVDLAVRFSTPIVRLYATSALPPDIEREDAIRTIGRALHACGRYAESHGVRLAVENHGPFPSEAANMVAILRAADSPAVGLTLHIPRETADQLIEQVPDLIWHLHLTDNRKPLGEGGADLPSIVRQIKGTGYAGWWNHEGPPEPNPEPAEVRSLAHLERLLTE
ncbi:MAG TPA: sugar phosphate isomerase/epimerase family protein [Chloroflexota bacterium]|nr:sugar phosphate isomerase/epimerase family protein [Chloroflexota bacterium]